ncbi:MAG: hypothetical protein MI741_11505 [Rhodospirillales bacterium]|nr:hypothetical protein [Rhodospirillales bacterium]
MADLTESEESLVIRTDFSDDSAWNELKTAITQEDPIHGFQANVEFIDEAEYADLTTDRVLEIFPEGSNQTFVFLIDSETISNSEHPVLCIDLFDERGRSFRVVPSEIWAVENNLAIANMDFAEFADNADEDGVFRGFPE